MKTEKTPQASLSQGRLSKAPRPRASIKETFSAIGILIKQLSPFRGHFLAGLLALAIGSGINLLFPEVIRRTLAPSNFSWAREQVGLITAILALLFVIQGIAFYARSYLFGVVGQRVFARIREQLFRSIIAREILFFDTHRSGDLASRINSDAALIQDAVSIKLSVILRYGLQVIAGTILMACMSWRMTLAIIASVLCMVVASALFARVLRAASRAYQGALAKLTAFAAECFAGVKVVHVLGAEKPASQVFGIMNEDALQAGERRVIASARFSSGAGLVLNLLLLLVLWYGIHLVLTEELPLNNLAAFALYGAIVAVSFSFLVGAYAELMQSVGGLERVFELIGEGYARTVQERSRVASHGPVSLTLENVSFAYPTRPEVPVLDRLSFSVAPGSITGLVGPSGSGKSTIAQLLLKLYTPTSGTILVNGLSLDAISDDEIRSSIAWVPQEPYLFAFSVYDNLTFGNEHLEREEVERLVSSWQFLDFIASLPDGIDTQLGEQGLQLSGGQRQRLAIARAILRRPGLLVLDEATSGLDSQTEQQVIDAIRLAIPSSTLFIISHRLATVRNANPIIVINDGAVFEQGSHDELRHRQGLYQQYAARQALG